MGRAAAGWGAVVVLVAGLGAGCGTGPAGAGDCAGRRPGDVLLTELMLDPQGADTGHEWLEVWSSLDQALPLSGLTLYRRRPDGTGLKAVPLSEGELPAHGLLVFGDLSDGPWVGHGALAALAPLENARGVLGLRCGEVLLDEVTWTRAPLSGRSRMLGGGGGALPGRLEDRRWCDAPAEAHYAPGNAGTPGEPNPACPPSDGGGVCLEGGQERAVVHPGPGDLFVTEVMASPAAAADVAGEWVEVQARVAVDLNGLTLANAAGAADTLRSERCLAVPAGGTALLARALDPFLNGGLPSPLATYQVPLTGQNERVALRLGDAGVDEARVRASTPGRAWQLDPGFLDAEGNDDPAHFCLARGHWQADGGGDEGSPGAPNPPCPGSPTPTPTPGPGTEPDAGPAAPPTCLDPGTGRPRATRAPARGQVTLSEVMVDPAAVPDATGEYVELAVTREVDLNGLALGVAAGKRPLVASAQCQAAAAGSYPLFGKSRDWWLNGGLPLVAGLLGLDLRNAGDTLRLLGADGGVLDELAWTSSTAGVSLQVQGGRTCLTPRSATHHYGLGDVGTPGRPNVACP